MQMGYDFDGPRKDAGEAGRLAGFARPFGTADEWAADVETRRPEWSALRARFVALHALRRSLADRGESAHPGGAFLDRGATVLATCRPAPSGVNLTCSAYGKVGWSITPAVAAAPSSGDRGME